MLTLEEKIQNLQTILNTQQNLTQETKQTLLKEIIRLEQELALSINKK